MEKVNVGIVLLHGPIKGGGGAQRRFGRIIQLFQQKGNSVRCVLITHSEMRERLDKSEINIDPKNVVVFSEIVDTASMCQTSFFRYICHIINSIRYFFRLKRIVKENQINIIHFVAPEQLFIPFLFFRDRKIGVVFSMVAAPPWDIVIEGSWTGQLVWRMFFKGSDVIDSLYSRFVDEYPMYRSKTRITSCSFTDYNHFRPAKEKEKLMVFAGRLHPLKNPMLFAEAAAMISKEIRKNGWKLIIFGKGELEGRIKSYIGKNRIKDIISVQSRWDISPVLSRSKVFVSLQKEENYPSQSLIEAMSSGNAIIATDVGETRRLVDETNGIFLKEHSASALSHSMRSLIENEPLCEELGNNSRNHIISGQTLEIAAEYFKRLWLDLFVRKRSGEE